MKLTTEQLLEKAGALLAEENAQPECWWYLSFASETSFLGVAIVRGRGKLSAYLTARSYSASSGGEMLAIPLDAATVPEPKYWNRLLTKQEVDAAFASSGGGADLWL